MNDKLPDVGLGNAQESASSSKSVPVLQTLWKLRKEQHIMTCVVVSASHGEELRVFVEDDLYLTEPYPHHDSLMGRAHVLHRNLLLRGWTDVESPASGI